MHRRAGFRQAGDDHFLHGFVFEQVHRQLGNGLARRAFAHADQDHAVADRHHITALKGGVTVVQVRVAVPDLEICFGELGVEFVDGGGQQGFLTTCRPVHRVEGDATVNPAGGVAGELGVGQRRQDEAGVAEEVAEHLDGLATETGGQIVARDAADQELGDLARLQAAQPRGGFVDQAQAHRVGGDLALQNPVQGFGDGDDVGQQVVHFQHIDVTFAHLGDEVEVVALGLGHPQHIIEQQFIAVVRGQPLMGQAWGANHDFAQFAGFGMDAVLNFFRGHYSDPPDDKNRGFTESGSRHRDRRPPPWRRRPP
ncbi:hypothetical protein D3C73_649880 [compost metagenome]